MEQDDPRELIVDAAEALAGELDLDGVLEAVVRAAQGLCGARYAALGVIGQDERLERFVHVGMDDATVRAIGPYPAGRGVLGLLIREPRIIRLDDMAEHPDSVGFPDHHPPMREFLGAPVRMSGRIYGNLYLADKAGGFSEQDEGWLGIFASIAGAAIENALLSDQLQDLAVQQERDRISRDLHDGIIQSLFSIGMTLDAAVPLIASAPELAASRVSGAVDGIDFTIRDLRNMIFHLRPQEAASLGLRGGIVELAREHEVNALVRPRLDLNRELDDHVPATVVPDVLQVVREGLSNVARHARASTVTVRADLAEGCLVVEVIDDGVGFVPTSPSVGRGLENVAERAQVLGGAVDIRSAPGEGTRLTLTVPVQEDP